ncbi:hypothetical protein B0H14DRAFT_3132147 [Mycena olivaceomarginata]|nr:hypothetical protein B0H14DRAFT_3132147 [Mycena olivaceomarginata]
MAPANATCHFIPPDVILETSGALLIGFLIQQFLLGVVVAQACTYYSRFHRRDIKVYRYLVGVILLVNFLHAGMNIHIIYRTSITAGYSESPAFGSQGWTMWAEPGVTAIVVLFAQFFFLDRCWSVIKRPWTILPLFGLHMAVLLLPVGSGLAMSVLSFKVKVLSEINKLPIPTSIWLGSVSSRLRDFVQNDGDQAVDTSPTGSAERAEGFDAVSIAAMTQIRRRGAVRICP